MTPHIIQIQASRAVAVIMVLFIHAIQFIPAIFLHNTWIKSYSNLWVFGGAGVDLFFVISGYVIAMTANNYPNLRQYMIARFIRVAPIYWLYTLLFLVVLMIGAILKQQENWFSLTHLIESLLFINANNPDGSYQPLLNVGWSLNYEAFFYVSFSFFAWRIYYLITGSLIGLFYLVHIGYYQPIIFEFLIGVLFYTYRDTLKIFNPSFKLAFTLIILSSAILLISAHPYLEGGWLRLGVWGIAVSILFLGISYIPNEGIPLSFKIIGDASYTLYLSHWFFRFFLYKLIPIEYIGLEASIILGISLMLITGIVLYLYIEKPLLIRIKSSQQYKKIFFNHSY